MRRDKRIDRGAVDESSPEQQICDKEDHTQLATFIVRKSGLINQVKPGLMVGRQAGRRKSCIVSEFLKILYMGCFN